MSFILKLAHHEEAGMDIREQIREYIVQNLLFTDDGFTYSDDDSLLEEGIIDSVGVMNLVLFIEERFNIQIPDQDITRDHFDSVNKLGQYISSKTT
jgi:acyl carrier protein